MLVMTAEEVAQAQALGRKRTIKGADVRNHNGARSIAHQDLKRKDQRRRWNAQDKRKALNGDY